MATVFDRLRRVDKATCQRVASVDLDAPSRLKPARRHSPEAVEALYPLNPGSPDGRQPRRQSPPPRTFTEAGEEGYISLGRSAVRHRLVLAVAILLGLLFGIGAGSVISPTYTAQAELIIGKSLNLTNTAAIAGFPGAEAQLAQNYARLAGTPAYDRALHAKLGRPLQGETSATQVAQSPVIDVYGYSPSQADALALANAASAALIDTINSVNQQTSAANQAKLSEYQAQAVVLEQDQQNLNQLQAKVAATGGPTRSPLEPQLVQASAAVDTDRFKLNTLGNQYGAAFDPNMAIQGAVSPLGGAAAQGGNHTTHIEIGGIAGLVAGVLVGLAIAAFMDVRADRRFRRAFNL